MQASEEIGNQRPDQFLRWPDSSVWNRKFTVGTVGSLESDLTGSIRTGFVFDENLGPLTFPNEAVPCPGSTFLNTWAFL